MKRLLFVLLVSVLSLPAFCAGPLKVSGRVVEAGADGNKESLASNFESVDGYNKCVCVDIRYILWILRHYVGTDYVLKEII